MIKSKRYIEGGTGLICPLIFMYYDCQIKELNNTNSELVNVSSEIGSICNDLLSEFSGIGQDKISNALSDANNHIGSVRNSLSAAIAKLQAMEEARRAEYEAARREAERLEAERREAEAREAERRNTARRGH